jgi:hypothetical protein
MGYIGQPLNAGNLAVQSGTGDGSDTTPIATLDYSVGSSESVAVYLDGVRQLAGTDFTASGTTLTFTTAPANGVGIDVYFLALPISLPTPGDSTVTNAKVSSSAAIATTKLGAGAVVQVVNVIDSAVATGTTAIANDNTIGQNTEGDQYMSLAITPTSATNILRIDVCACISSSNVNMTSMTHLFQDSTADALATAHSGKNQVSFTAMVNFTHWMVSGTTSSTTFKVRAGHTTGATTTFNGQGGTRVSGGVNASSITITEIAV